MKDLFRCTELFEATAVENRQAVSHEKSLFLVVGDEDHASPNGLEYAANLLPYLPAQVRVQAAEGLVQQQKGRLGSQGAH